MILIMTKLPRTHLSIMYDELWADHLNISLGITVKPFKDRCSFSWTNPQKPLNKGFKVQKPNLFIKFDNIFIEITRYDMNLTLPFLFEFIKLADNRMMQGDYRYGSILRQNLNNYDIVEEYFRRLRTAKHTKNREYLVDAYNMLRIQYFKNKNINEIIDLYKYHLKIFLQHAVRNKWKFITIDDGIHAQEK